ncbi:unnamed protein product [Mytilus coruscus]|uniref:Retropepsins domain-containing protein n=1 Tax=Mytilus coruscus TaxID=42192 RepID=A0A6J8CV14_MYTCO|nr:unnamed protein product [Mytilus coruscus]
MEDHLINIHVEDPLSNIIAVDCQIEIPPGLMPIDQQHPHKARDHIVPKDNGQHLHGQTPEISQRVGPVGQRSTPKSIGHETSPHDKTEQRPTSSSDIVIRRTIGKSLVVRGTIYDQNVSMIVDTAAMITLVNEKLIAADNEDSETVTLRGLGEQLVTGKIIKNTSLDIDRVNIQWDVCKAPLTDNVILGLDILDTLGAVINLSTLTLTINNKVINAAFVNSGVGTADENPISDVRRGIEETRDKVPSALPQSSDKLPNMPPHLTDLYQRSIDSLQPISFQPLKLKAIKEQLQ